MTNKIEINGGDINFSDAELNQALDEFHEKYPQLKQINTFKENLKIDALKGEKFGDTKSNFSQEKYLPERKEDKCWVNLYSGVKFYPLNPDTNTINIEDIARSLSMLCRFNGHVSEFYSIAQHSVLVSYFCDTEDRLAGLLHDSSEYILNDIFSPLKKTNEYSEYRKIENHLQRMIYKKIGLNEDEPKSVKRADLLVLALEAQTLLPNRHPDWKMPFDNLPPLKITPLNPKEAEKLFLDRFFELFNKNK